MNKSVSKEIYISRFATTLHTPKQQWSMSVRLRDFSPEDVIVKVVNHTLEVKAEKISQNGRNKAKFTQKSQLPKNVDATTVTPWLYEDGTLVLRADLKTTGK